MATVTLQKAHINKGKFYASTDSIHYMAILQLQKLYTLLQSRDESMH
jgi:hypothetical protein